MASTRVSADLNRLTRLEIPPPNCASLLVGLGASDGALRLIGAKRTMLVRRLALRVARPLKANPGLRALLDAPDRDHGRPIAVAGRGGHLRAQSALQLFRIDCIKRAKETGAKQKVCDAAFWAQCKDEFARLPAAMKSHYEREAEIAKDSARGERLRKRQRLEAQAALALGDSGGNPALAVGDGGDRPMARIEDKCQCCALPMTGHRPQMWHMHLATPEQHRPTSNRDAASSLVGAFSPTQASSVEQYPISVSGCIASMPTRSP